MPARPARSVSLERYSDPNELLSAYEKGAARLAEINADMVKASIHGIEAGEYEALNAEYTKQVAELDAYKALLANVRRPSMAQRIGSQPSFYGTQPGDFITGVMKARSADYETQREGKDILAGISTYQVNEKATLGSTAATGGWVMPNAAVDDLLKPGAFTNPYMQLMTVVRGVNNDVDIPWRGTAPSRALVITWGDTKTNLDLAYNGYTATMYTLAQVYDLSVQFVERSAGAAEQDVLGELRHGFDLGTGYYIRQGNGSGEPYGLQTAVTAAPFSPTITTSHSPAATLAGSVSKAIGAAAGDLLARNRRPTGAVLSATGYSTLLTEGADQAGFYLAGLPGAGQSSPFAPGTLVSPFGIPVYVDPGFGSDDLYVADWSAFKVYIGNDLRIDTSNVAGDRWDKNLVGFRGELDMAFDARPAVYSGALQVVADIIP